MTAQRRDMDDAGRSAYAEAAQPSGPGPGHVQYMSLDVGGPVSWYRIQNRMANSRMFWIGAGAATLFAAGVGLMVLVNGVDATPHWMRTAAIIIGGIVLITILQGAINQALHRHSIRNVQKHLAEGDLRRAAVELMWLVEENEKLVGPDDPLVLRWKLTLAHVLLRRGNIGEAMPMLEYVVMTQLNTLGPDHPDTLRTARLMDRLTANNPLAEPVEIWWQPV